MRLDFGLQRREFALHLKRILDIFGPVKQPNQRAFGSLEAIHARVQVIVFVGYISAGGVVRVHFQRDCAYARIHEIVQHACGDAHRDKS